MNTYRLIDCTNMVQSFSCKDTDKVFYGTYCNRPQYRNRFFQHHVDVKGLSNKKATERRRFAYNQWILWKNFWDTYDQEISKETNGKVRKRKSYMANKLRQ